MSFLLLAFIWLFSLMGQFARIQTPVGRLSIHELILPLFIAWSLWLSRASIRAFNVSKIPLWVRWLMIFLAWTALTTILNAWRLHSTELFVTGMSYLARLSLYLAFALSLWLQLRQNFVKKEHIWLGVWSWIAFQALFGAFQFLVFPDTRLFKYLGWDDHLSRAFGTLFDPGFFGLICAFGALLSLHAFLQRKPSGARWWLQQVVLVVTLTALALSFSRASYVAFLFGTMVLAWLWQQRRVLLIFPLFVMILFLLPKDGGGEGQKLTRTNSIAAREEVLSYHARGLTANEVLLGRGWYYESALHLHEVGLGNVEIPLIKNAQSVDMLYAHVFFSTGIVGLGLFTASLVALIRSLRGKSLSLAVLGATLIHSLFAPSLIYSWVLLLLISLFMSEEIAPNHKERKAKS